MPYDRPLLVDYELNKTFVFSVYLTWQMGYLPLKSKSRRKMIIPESNYFLQEYAFRLKSNKKFPKEIH